MNKIHIILFLLITNLILAGVLYYREVISPWVSPENIIDSASGSEVTFIEEKNLTLEDALELDAHIYDSYHLVDKNQNEKVYENFYNEFDALESYEDYKKFTQKYPALLFVIYAAKNKDRENYLKFYNFIFNKVLEENNPKYIQDLKDIWGDNLEWEELREPFMETIASQYEIISSWTNPFSLNLGHGPIHIALTADSLEEAKKHCDEGEISWVDELTRQECYNYVIHYRATKNNNYCSELFWEYDRAMCNSYLASTSQ